MARIKKPAGRLSSGPWDYRDFVRVLQRERWQIEEDHEHVHLVHGERRGKIQLSKKWTAVKTGHDVFKGIAGQGGYTPKELKRLMNAR